MAEFSFGQVEAVLAWLNDVADHKRTAFASRLKHLQKYGLPTRDRPGRGKTGMFNFCQLLQFGIGLEFVQSGMPPQMAARMTAGSWSRMRNTAYLSTWPDLEIDDEADDGRPDYDFSTNWVWLVTLEALKDLSKDGSGEWDHMEAVEPIPIGEVAQRLWEIGEHPLHLRPRTLIIYGSKLIRDMMSLIEWTFRFSTGEAMRADLREEIDADKARQDAALETIETISPRKMTDAQRGAMAAAIQEWADFAQSADEPTADAIAIAREVVPKLSQDARNILAEIDPARRSGIIISEESRAALHELIGHAFIEVKLVSDMGDDSPEITIIPTRLGEAASSLLRKGISFGDS